MSRVDTMIRSARLPGLSEPILSSMPMERAPSMVASSSTRRAVSLNSLSLLAFSMFWMNFMMPNMSALPLSSTVSTDNPTGMLAASRLAVCGKPKPMRSSVVGEADRGASGLDRRDLPGGEHDAVDDLHVLAEQVRLAEAIDLAGGGPRAAGMHGDRQAEPPRRLDLLGIDFRRNRGRRAVATLSAPGHAERDETAVRIALPVPFSRSRSSRSMVWVFGCACIGP